MRNESSFWRNYIKIGSSMAKCDLCNKVYEVKDDRLSMKAKLHLLKEHKRVRACEIFVERTFLTKIVVRNRR